VVELLLLSDMASADTSPQPLITGTAHHGESQAPLHGSDTPWRSSQLLSGGTLRRIAEAAEKRAVAGDPNPAGTDDQVCAGPKMQPGSLIFR
jgi:hypothetical protein